MRLKIIAALLVAAGLATTLCGVASASGRTTATKSSTEHFWVSGFSPRTGKPTEFVGTGLFTDAGKLIGHHKVVLSKGTFVVNKSKLHGSFKLDKTSCLVAETVSGSVSLGHGTGAYKGISGTLPVKGSAEAVLPRTKSGKCNENSSSVLGITGEFSGSGTVTISG